MKSRTSVSGRLLGNILKRYPAETLLSIYAFAAGCLAYKGVTAARGFCAAAALCPVFYAVSLIANKTGAKRIVYYLSALLPIPFMFADGAAEWAKTPEYAIALILSLLAVAICGRKSDNKAFVRENVGYASAGIISVIFSLIVIAVAAAIYCSAVYIFELTPHYSAIAYTSIASGTILASAVFLFFQERYARKEQPAGKVLTVLLNCIITPALIAYTAILYLYIVKTLVTLELPKGGAANMVFAFAIIFTAVKALQEIITERRYDWFFGRFSLAALPPLALFWAGTARRIIEYGLTEWRVYLIVCGAIMTICVALFFSKRTGKYLYACIAAFVLFAATYLPPVSAERLARKSQTTRIIKAAREAGVLGKDGRLILGDGSPADTLCKRQHRRIHESLEYLAKDSARLAEFGLSHYYDYAASLSPETRRYCGIYRENDSAGATTADTLAVEEPDTAAITPTAKVNETE